MCSGAHKGRPYAPCIDTLRGANGLAAYPWTDSTLTPGTTAIRALHIVELRAALNEVYDELERTRPSWSPILGQTPVQAAHVSAVRDAVRAIW